ncbi:hypothetical protein [Cryptosporangium japonicum]|uniref:Uncharacterized protein n=1 Tax=Cryptosporangium japonicum TaxID=80872 RepID=A0ABP3D406_9ACTN
MTLETRPTGLRRALRTGAGFGMGTWQGLFEALTIGGPSRVISSIRAEERSQLPELAQELDTGRWVKRHDDATAVLVYPYTEGAW